MGNIRPCGVADRRAGAYEVQRGPETAGRFDSGLYHNISIHFPLEGRQMYYTMFDKKFQVRKEK